MKKQPITIRIDADVLAWFKSQGKGYQSRINDALRSHYGMKSGKGCFDVEEYYRDDEQELKTSATTDKIKIETSGTIDPYFKPHQKTVKGKKK